MFNKATIVALLFGLGLAAVVVDAATQFANVLAARRGQKLSAVLQGKPRYVQRLLGRKAADITDNNCFAFDDSGSVGAQGFKCEQDFAKAEIDFETNNGQLGIRMAGVKFSTDASTAFSFTLDPVAAKADVDAMVYSNGRSTNIGQALQAAATLLNGQIGERVLLLLSDAQHNDGPDPVPIAEQLCNDGIVIVVGPVANADIQLMKQIACHDMLVLPPIADMCVAASNPAAYMAKVANAIAKAPLYVGTSKNKATQLQSFSKNLGFAADSTRG